MTTTVEQIVRGALQLIGVLDIGQAIPPGEAQDGLAYFNDMIASWPAHGIFTGAGAVTLTDPSPLEEHHTKALKNLLAVEMSAPYGKTIPSQVDYDARQGWQMIEADFKVIEKQSMDNALLVMPSQRRHW